jgi:hypothetical protein
MRVEGIIMVEGGHNKGKKKKKKITMIKGIFRS